MPSDTPRFYSEIYVELTREDGRLVQMDLGSWLSAPAREVATAGRRFYARDDRGQKVYLTGQACMILAAAQDYRRSLIPVNHARLPRIRRQS